MSNSDYLLSVEAEAYVDSLSCSSIEDICKLSWCDKHQRLQKLSIQAALEATQNKEEHIKELLITYDKLGVLVHEVVCSEMWRCKIFSALLDMNDGDQLGLFPYSLGFYHELASLNLLSVVLYHPAAREALKDSVVDLADYCCRQLVPLAAGDVCYIDKGDGENLSVHEQFTRFTAGSLCLSILRYLSEEIDSLLPSVATCLLVNNDVPVLLVTLLMKDPWTKRNEEGEMQHYNCATNKWVEVSEFGKLSEPQAQLWLAIYSLVFSNSFVQSYDVTTYRRDQLGKLLPRMNEYLVDQIPPLQDLQRYLAHLSVTAPPPPKPRPILEVVPPIQAAILKDGKGKWKSRAQQLFMDTSKQSKEQYQKAAQSFVSVFSEEVLDAQLGPRKCVLCGNPAPKKCSRCKEEWYCRRECQVKHWPKHKVMCDLVAGVKSSKM